MHVENMSASAPPPAIFGIDLYAADIPSLVVTVGNAMTILKFTKGCEFIVPKPKKRAIWPEGEAAAADSGIELTVRPYTWWVVADGYTQIGVSFKPAHGNSYVLEITDGRMDTFMRISPEAAKSLFSTLKEAMREIRRHLRSGSDGVFRPAETVLEYHVKTWVYRHPHEVSLPPRGSFPPRFR
jgi:hypothetical protein